MDAGLFWQLVADICKLGEFIASTGTGGVSANIVGRFQVGYDGSEGSTIAAATQYTNIGNSSNGTGATKACSPANGRWNVMHKLSTLGRIFLAIAMVAFGIQHFVHMDFVTRVFPRLPAWIPAHSFMACVFGALLLLAGAAIMFEKAARPVALLLGAIILSSFALLYLPPLITGPLLPFNGGLWTSAGKALALSGGSFLVAGSLPVKLDGPTNALARVARSMEKFIPLGRFFLAAFLILCGIEHFMYVEIVTSMVPSWIPGGVFWTYFAGVALIAGGAGMCIPLTLRPAAAGAGLMIFIWVVILHIPRAVAMRNSNETTAVFEALAFSGVAFILAAAPREADMMVFEK